MLGNILYDLNPRVKVKGKKVGICDGVPSTAALVVYKNYVFHTKFIIDQGNN